MIITLKKIHYRNIKSDDYNNDLGYVDSLFFLTDI